MSCLLSLLDMKTHREMSTRECRMGNNEVSKGSRHRGKTTFNGVQCVTKLSCSNFHLLLEFSNIHTKMISCPEEGKLKFLIFVVGLS